MRSRGRNEPTTIDAFLTDVLAGRRPLLDAHVRGGAACPSRACATSGSRPAPACSPAAASQADDRAAFYCPADDTIYVAQRFAADLYNGVARGLPGESAGIGRAAGDFAVAYVLAHEYAHNLQQELGIFDNRVTESAQAVRAAGRLLRGHVGALRLRAGRPAAGRPRGGDERGARRRRLRRRQRPAPRHAAGAARRAARRLRERRPVGLQPLRRRARRRAPAGSPGPAGARRARAARGPRSRRRAS